MNVTDEEALPEWDWVVEAAERGLLAQFMARFAEETGRQVNGNDADVFEAMYDYFSNTTDKDAGARD